MKGKGFIINVLDADIVKNQDIYKPMKWITQSKRSVRFCTDHYSLNPFISFTRDNIVLQLQLNTPGSVSITS